MASAKGAIERECGDCGRWTERGETVVRAVLSHEAEPGTRVAVWVCERCLVNVRNVAEIEAALQRRQQLERRTIGVWRKFRR
jgi:hypothetical protein